MLDGPALARRTGATVTGGLRRRGFAALVSAQCLGSFNDNLLKMVVSLLAAGMAAKTGSSGYLSLTSAVFILPYILFSGYAGFVADRFDKRRVLILGKVLEILLMALALVALVSGQSSFLLSVLFLIATQATFFSPAKYGILPELLREKDLPEANGYLEMSRYAAVILGTATGGAMLAMWHDRPAVIGTILITVACLGAAASLKIGAPQRSRSRKPFDPNPWSEIGKGIRRLLSDGDLWPAVAGLTYFETLGSLVLLCVLMMGKESMRTDDLHIGLLGACAGIGIALGAAAAGRLSRGAIKLSLITLGACGTGVMLICLSHAAESFERSGAALLGLGAFGGLFLVPLNSMLQRNAGRTEKGRVISTNNFLNMTGVLFSSGLLWLFHDLLRMAPEQIIFFTGLTALAITVWLLIRRGRFAPLASASRGVPPAA